MADVREPSRRFARPHTAQPRRVGLTSRRSVESNLGGVARLSAADAPRSRPHTSDELLLELVFVLPQKPCEHLACLAEVLPELLARLAQHSDLGLRLGLSLPCLAFGGQPPLLRVSVRLSPNQLSLGTSLSHLRRKLRPRLLRLAFGLVADPAGIFTRGSEQLYGILLGRAEDVGDLLGSFVVDRSRPCTFRLYRPQWKSLPRESSCRAARAYDVP
jgi:hypothetical protein